MSPTTPFKIAFATAVLAFAAACEGPDCSPDACGKSNCDCFWYVENPADKRITVCVSTDEYTQVTSHWVDDENGDEVFECEGDCGVALMETVSGLCEQ